MSRYSSSIIQNKGANRMNLALHMSKRQLLFLVLLFIALIVTALFVIHSTTPSLWHSITDLPDIMNRQP